MDTATAATLADLRKQLEQARSYIDGQDVRSDFRNVTEMRKALEAATARAESLSASIVAACSGSGCLNAHELRVALDAAQSEISGFKYMMQRGQDWMNSAHDLWQTMLRKRDEALEELKKALADNATLNTAKDQLIDERDSLRQQLEQARSYIDGQDVRSDYKNVTEMRAALDAARAREEAYLADVVRLTAELQGERDDLAATHNLLRQAQSLCGDWQMAVMLAVPHGTVWDAGNPKAMVQTIVTREEAYRADVVRLTAEAQYKDGTIELLRSEVVRLNELCEKERSLNVVGEKYQKSTVVLLDRSREALASERSRAEVLAAEVRAWNAAEHLCKDEPHAEFRTLAEARARTRETQALDAGKFTPQITINVMNGGTVDFSGIPKSVEVTDAGKFEVKP